jgi:hypothetical protein
MAAQLKALFPLKFFRPLKEQLAFLMMAQRQLVTSFKQSKPNTLQADRSATLSPPDSRGTSTNAPTLLKPVALAKAHLDDLPIRLRFPSKNQAQKSVKTRAALGKLRRLRVT